MIPQDKSGAVGYLSSNNSRTLTPVLGVGSIRLSTLALCSPAGHLPGFASFKHPSSGRLLQLSTHTDLLVFWYFSRRRSLSVLSSLFVQHQHTLKHLQEAFPVFSVLLSSLLTYTCFPLPYSLKFYLQHLSCLLGLLVDLCSLCFCSAIFSAVWTALLSPLNPVGATNVKHEMHTRRQYCTRPIKLEISSVLPALHWDTHCTFTLAIKICSRPGSKLLCENHLPHLWSRGFLRELCFGILVGSPC